MRQFVKNFHWTYWPVKYRLKHDFLFHFFTISFSRYCVIFERQICDLFLDRDNLYWEYVAFKIMFEIFQHTSFFLKSIIINGNSVIAFLKFLFSFLCSKIIARKLASPVYLSKLNINELNILVGESAKGFFLLLFIYILFAFLTRLNEK